MKTTRKCLAVLLAVIMACSVMPFAVFAEQWQTAAAEAAAEVPADDTADEPLQGDLISAEITVGNTKSTYAVNDAGDLVLVSEEIVSKRGLLRAPLAAQSAWAAFSDDTLVDAANWAMANPIGTAATFTDQNGNAAVVYGASGFGTFTDTDYDLICNECHYCINGCTDGTSRMYTEADIEGITPDEFGRYIRNDVLIATKAHGDYTYVQVDENGNTIYEEDGVTPKIVTTKYDYIQYESYMDGAEGTCDVCGQTLCIQGHSYGDGLCDGCGSCVGTHTDDTGAFKISGDGICDFCGKEPHECSDGDDEDELCDICGKESHDCVDEAGTQTPIGDGFCDTCGYCMNTDANENACVDADTDGVCDNCAKPYLLSCDHSDRYGAAVCSVCHKEPCHQSLNNLQKPAEQLADIAEVLGSRDADGTAAYHDWLTGTLQSYLSPSENGEGSGLGDEIARRNAMENAVKTNRIFLSYVDAIRNLTLESATSAELVGKLTEGEGGKVLDESDSMFTQVARQIANYKAGADGTSYTAAKPYYTEYNTLDDLKTELNTKLTDVAGAVFDNQLEAVYGSTTPKGVTVTAQNRSKLRAAVKAVDEAVLYKLYGAEYSAGITDELLNNTWNNNAPDLSDPQKRRAVGYLLLKRVRDAINELSEASFTDFEQITFDSDGYYTVRKATDDDILRTEGNDADDYIVTDQTIKTLITRIDGFLASPEAINLVQKLLPDSFGFTIQNYDTDPNLTVYDLIMSFLAQKLFSDDLINQIFTIIFPTVTSIPAQLPDLLTNDYIRKKGNGHYSVDIVNAITLAAGGSASMAQTLSSILDVISIGGSLDIYLDGARNTKSIKKLLTDAGFSFWPKQVATLLSRQNGDGKFTSIINALNGCNDDWSNLGELNFEWHIENFQDFKRILSVVLGAVSPVLEMLFSDKIQVNKKMDMRKAAYFSILASLTLISIPAASDVGLEFYPSSMHIYDDIIVPIFEALGVNNFAPADGSTEETYTFSHIRFATGDSTTVNVGKVVDGLLDPALTLLHQFAHHPLEKLLSVLPNITLMLENGKLLELLDIDNTFDAFLEASFNTDSLSDFFDGLGDIIEDQIMKHWYDWLNPVKYAQVVATTAAYAIFQPALGLLFSFLNLIDLEWLADMGLLDVTDMVNGVMSDSVFPMLPDLFNVLAGMLGGKLNEDATNFDWPKNVKLSSSNLIGDLNLYELIDKYFTSSDARAALGFNLGQPSSVIRWFFENLEDSDGNHIKFFAQELLSEENFLTLSSLGEMKVLNDGVRDSKYKNRWTKLNNGDYYFVKADISDVFYFCVDMLSSVISDKEAVSTILAMVGMDYDDIKAALSKLADDQMETLNFPLAALLKNACTGGKLDLDKLLSSLSTDNLLAVMCESLVPQNGYASAELTYPTAPESKLEDVTQHDGKIPYLEYDNRWTTDLAAFAVNDIDDVADALLQELPLDLNKETPEIETLREFIRPLILKYLNEPGYLTLVTQLLCNLYDDALAQPADLIKDATGIDVTGWKNDFGYLFDETAEAPTERAFPNLRGERAGTDENGDPLVNWYYKDTPVATYSDIFAAFGELLTPLQPVLDMVFCGNDFRVLQYTKAGVPAADALLTIQGHDGYNFAILPLLEAMGIEDALTPAEFKAAGTARGLLQCVDLIVTHLFDILNDDDMLAQLLEMLAQLMYAVSGNGATVMIQNMLRPVWLLLDTLRPIVNIDLDALANTMLCRFTYKIGKYASADEMMDILQTRRVGLRLKTVSVDALLDLASAVASIVADGERIYLDLKSPYHTAMEDLACLREGFTSKAYAINADGQQTTRTAYRLNITGPNALTSMLSMGLECLLYGSNADVLDAVLNDLLGLKGVCKTAIELMKGLPAEYSIDFNWAYILGENATADEKAALLDRIIADGEIDVEAKRTAQAQSDFDQYLKSYNLTDWDEETAVWLVDHLDAMITNVLSADLGDGKIIGAMILDKLGVATEETSFTIGSFAQALANGLLTDKTIDSLLGILSDVLNGLGNDAFGKMAQRINPEHPEDALGMMEQTGETVSQFRETIFKIAKAFGIDLNLYCIDPEKTVYENGKAIYYAADGTPTGLVRPALQGDYTRVADVVATLLQPFNELFAFLLLGKDIKLFNTAGIPNVRARRDDLIAVTGLESYGYVVLPLMEALGCDNLKPAAYYTDDDYAHGNEILYDLLSAGIGRLQAILDGDTMDSLLCTLPDLLYYINSYGFGVSLQNLTAQIVAILDFYNDYAGKTGDDRLTLQGLLKQFTGLDIDLTTVKLTDLLGLLAAKGKDDDGNEEVYRLALSDFAARLLDNFTIGKIYYNGDSVCAFPTYRMACRDSKDKAALATILPSLALDLLEDPDNTGFWDALLGANVRQTVINVLNLNDFEFDYQDPTWLFTEYADTDHLVSALTLSQLFSLDPYAGKLWTREKAAELADNLEQFVNDMLYLLGLEINGIKITDLRSLMHALIGGMLFSNDMVNRIAAMLGQIKPYLDRFDPDGAIAGFIQRLIGIDLHAWDAYAPGGIYENGRDWGFSSDSSEAAVDANGAIFEAALVELLSPVAPAMAWLLADSDYTFFAEGDGLGKNAEAIQLTLPGAEGYKYALVPLFEALNIDGSPKNLVKSLRDGDICDPAEYTANVKEDVSFAVTGVVHPLVAMVQKLMDSTATQLLELFPSIVYFINSNGIDTVVQNLIHAVKVIANAAEPMKEQINMLVYDEQGLDLSRTLQVEKIVKENLYTMIGVTEKDVAEIYEQCGGTWKTVDGLEDIDFRLLFSVGLAAVNNFLAKNGVPFKFTSIAALAVNELTHGYVRSFNSLTGKTAYTMVLDKEIDRYCYGDLISILVRIILKFLSVDGNTEALMALIQTKAQMDDTCYDMTLAFLRLLTSYMGSLGGFETAMITIYYTVYGASKGSGAGVDSYDRMNDRWGSVVDKLKNNNNDIARAVLQTLFGIADEQTGDIIGSDGIAGNGLIRFFKQIYDWFMRIINFFRGLFK